MNTLRTSGCVYHTPQNTRGTHSSTHSRHTVNTRYMAEEMLSIPTLWVRIMEGIS